MELDSVFTMVSVLAMFGWALLVGSPWIPVWSDRIVSRLVAVLLAVAYGVVVVSFPAERGGFGTFEEVCLLFTHPGAVLAGWIHFLAFDLLVGAWQCRVARDEGIGFGWVVPCLFMTFLLGPIGFLMFSALRLARASRS